MRHARAVAVVGFKDSGKTRVVEALVGELRLRGYSVGTLKHTVEDILLDTPGKDTWRHREAGSEASGILRGGGAAFFIDRPMTVNEAVSKLGVLDFVVLEGFKELATVAKLVVPREQAELDALSDGLEVAVVDLGGRVSGSRSGTPVFGLDEVSRLADVVEARSFPILPGLNCHGCGYDDCGEMALAIVAGDASVNGCRVLGGGRVVLKVDGEDVPLGSFVEGVTVNVVMGLVRSLKGVGEPRSVELSIEVDGDV